jgi:hypothetical protein
VKVYKYFVFYHFQNWANYPGVANAVIQTDKPISQNEHIKQLSKQIEETTDHKNVVISNIVRLED